MSTPEGRSTLHHHACVLLPWFPNDGNPVLLLERKSPDYGCWGEALSLLGGNSTPEEEQYSSPLLTMQREIEEEFLLRTSADTQTWNEELGRPFLAPDVDAQTITPESQAIYTPEERRKVQLLGKIVLGGTGPGLRHGGDYAVTVPRTLFPGGTHYGATVFIKRLAEAEGIELSRLMYQELGGNVTPGNLLHGSRTEFLTVEKILSQNERFAWGYDHMINQLFAGERIPCSKRIPVEQRITVAPLSVQSTTLGPFYQDIRAAGFLYARDPN